MPINVTLSNNNESEILVEWKEPYHNGNTINSYYIFIKNGNFFEYFDEVSYLNQSIIINNNFTNKIIEIGISANNRGGSSIMSTNNLILDIYCI